MCLEKVLNRRGTESHALLMGAQIKFGKEECALSTVQHGQGNYAVNMDAQT